MQYLCSKAINKIKQDGVRSLISESIPWIRRRVQKEIEYGQENFKLFLYRKHMKNQYDQKLLDRNPDYIYIDPTDVEFYLTNSAAEFVCGGCERTQPEQIPVQELEKGQINPYIFSGFVFGGKWDLYKKRYEFDRVYKGWHQYHTGNKKDLRETEYMRQYELRAGVRCQNKRQYVNRKVKKVVSLYDKIKNKGFQTQYDLGEKLSCKPTYAKPWPITVNIGRDGEIIFNNTGHNRLAASQVLNLDVIPVLVVVRHNEWHATREKIRTTDNHSELNGRLKNKIDHPDIHNIFLPESR